MPERVPSSASYSLRLQFADNVDDALADARTAVDRDPSILTSRLRSRGAALFYQVRFGADTRPEADNLCNRIRKAGGACFVLKNMRG